MFSSFWRPLRRLTHSLPNKCHFFVFIRIFSVSRLQHATIIDCRRVPTENLNRILAYCHQKPRKHFGFALGERFKSNSKIREISSWLRHRGVNVSTNTFVREHSKPIFVSFIRDSINTNFPSCIYIVSYRTNKYSLLCSLCSRTNVFVKTSVENFHPPGM